MKSSLKVLFALFAITSASMYVVAGGHHLHGSSGSYTWIDDDHELSLHARDASGIVVDHVKPSPLHGLQAGDVILAVDGHGVSRIDELTHAIQAHPRGATRVSIRHGGHEMELTWSYDDAQAMFPPPPAPPAPPTAPTPPVPPTPPTPVHR